MRPSSMPRADRFSHGTRARYVTGCRCDACKRANVAMYHRRQREAIEAAKQITAEPVPAPQTWTRPDGTTAIRTYKRACPGVQGQPCATHSHLRKDSKGGVCSNCRMKLVWNGLVSAKRARKHIRALSRKGVGYKQLADSAQIAISIVGKIRSGEKKQIRAQTERRVLSVDEGAMADGAIVPAGRTDQRLHRILHEEGLSKRALAKRLGSRAKTPSLHIQGRDRLRASTVEKVRRLWNETCAQFDDSADLESGARE